MMISADLLPIFRLLHGAGVDSLTETCSVKRVGSRQNIDSKGSGEKLVVLSQTDCNCQKKCQSMSSENGADATCI